MTRIKSFAAAAAVVALVGGGFASTAAADEVAEQSCASLLSVGAATMDGRTVTLTPGDDLGGVTYVFRADGTIAYDGTKQISNDAQTIHVVTRSAQFDCNIDADSVKVREYNFVTRDQVAPTVALGSVYSQVTLPTVEGAEVSYTVILADGRSFVHSEGESFTVPTGQFRVAATVTGPEGTFFYGWGGVADHAEVFYFNAAGTPGTPERPEVTPTEPETPAQPEQPAQPETPSEESKPADETKPADEMKKDEAKKAETKKAAKGDKALAKTGVGAGAALLATGLVGSGAAFLRRRNA